MKKLITLLSSMSMMMVTGSTIVACQNPFAKEEVLDVNPPGSIGDPIENSNNFKWLGEIIGEEFDPVRAGQLEVTPDYKVIIQNVTIEKATTQFKVQNTANGGNLFEAVYDELRNVYGINVVNSVGNYDDFNIFMISEENGKRVEKFIYNNYDGSDNEVSSGEYLVKALSTSKRIFGNFTFQLELASKEVPEVPKIER